MPPPANHEWRACMRRAAFEPTFFPSYTANLRSTAGTSGVESVQMKLQGEGRGDSNKMGNLDEANDGSRTLFRRSAKLIPHGSLVLAPMVRVGSLPHRMLSLAYGADVVYTPETVDRRLLRCRRVANPLLNTVDFLDHSGALCLRLSPLEMERCVLQLGTSSPEVAVDSLKIVHNDVAGVDINCGCPKKFSMVSAMGAALLQFPERIIAILNAIKKTYPHLHVSCKLRMIPANGIGGKSNVPNEKRRIVEVEEEDEVKSKHPLMGSLTEVQPNEPTARSGTRIISRKDRRRIHEPAVAKYMKKAARDAEAARIAAANGESNGAVSQPVDGNKSEEDTQSDNEEPVVKYADTTYIEETLAFVERVYRETQVDAIGMHCRFPYEKTGASTAHWDIFEHVYKKIRELNEETGRDVTFLANGDIFNDKSQLQLEKECMGEIKTDDGPALMLARSAQFNPSVFGTLLEKNDEYHLEEMMSGIELLKAYIKVAIKYEMPYYNCKYCILILWPHSMGAEIRLTLIQSKNYKDLCQRLGQDMFEYYENAIKLRQERISELGLVEIHTVTPENTKHTVSVDNMVGAKLVSAVSVKPTDGTNTENVDEDSGKTIKKSKKRKAITPPGPNDELDLSNYQRTTLPPNIVGIEYSGLRDGNKNVPIRYFVRKDTSPMNTDKVQDENKFAADHITAQEIEATKGELPYIPDDRGYEEVYGKR